MYNGIGLPTTRGSGTDGHIQTNKFFVRPRPHTETRGLLREDEDEDDHEVSMKPNQDILEHNRKRQIELKLLILEDKLTDLGYTAHEISENLKEARKNLI